MALDNDQQEIILLLKRELERRFKVDNVKPKFDENGNFVGFTYNCSKEDHEVKAREIDRFFIALGLKNIDYVS